jgi:hypothetical protein
MDKPRLLEAPIACTSFCWVASSNNCWTTRRGSLMRLARSRTVSQPSTLMNFDNKLSRLRAEIPVAESPFGAAGAPWMTDESCSSVKYPRAIRFAPNRPPLVFWRSSASEIAASVTSFRFESISPKRIPGAYPQFGFDIVETSLKYPLIWNSGEPKSPPQTSLLRACTACSEWEEPEHLLFQPIVTNGLPLTSCLRSQRLWRRSNTSLVAGGRQTGLLLPKWNEPILNHRALRFDRLSSV